MSPPAASTTAAKESGPPPPKTKTVVEYEAKESGPPLQSPRTRSGITDNLQDVLAAAQAVAESAERAAAVARTAASLEQVRISELIRKHNEDKSSDNLFSGDNNHRSNTPETPILDRQSSTPDHDGGFGSSSPPPQPFSPHQSERLPSMEDGFMSYPNLFTSRSSVSYRVLNLLLIMLVLVMIAGGSRHNFAEKTVVIVDLLRWLLVERYGGD